MTKHDRSRGIGILVGLALLAALPDALFALWLKLLADGILAGARGRVIAAAVSGSGVKLQYVAAANHTWPQVKDGTWQLDGVTTVWAYLKNQ